MAANYWVSTQRQHWLFEKDQLLEVRRALDDSDKQLVQQFPLPDLRLFSIYINQQLIKLGKRMTTRQQALATAQVYIRRFYTKVEVRRTNPYLVLTTAFYLACKMEECPQHIRFVVGEARGLWPDFIASDISKLGECEFWLISEMNSQLIVHHPYRTLSELQGPLGLTPDEVALAWSVVNDHYLTDLPLLQPPHVISVMAILVAVVFKPGPANVHIPGASSVAAALRDGSAGSALAAFGERAAGGALPPRVQKIVDWLATSEVDIEAVIDCTQELVSLYEVWEQYSEKSCKEQIGRFVKGRALDK
ncbi:RNA polymerase II holoenzyme cyclin-like subunit [Polytolypa hystricis UAMH7299]|uniref:RNA polymerase II holoenzyme cyclin-like subunit n=1 Tax=Polytolypa hystricis (strain UAMH7299) TaxID=1447883 RepID=A0A2B7XRZ3_POLH7|nr:RNA polymerase II holoenzyme cyclin-like subunit [Polytolypa hystricis UAMH7299]